MIKVYKADINKCDECSKEHTHVISTKNNCVYLCDECFEQVLSEFKPFLGIYKEVCVRDIDFENRPLQKRSFVKLYNR